MSWSVRASGKAVEVAAALKLQFESITYLQEPEKTVMQHMAAAVEYSLRHFPDEQKVVVSANGSQNQRDGGHRIVNNVTLRIEPDYRTEKVEVREDTPVVNIPQDTLPPKLSDEVSGQTGDAPST